jgi:hypothetical protein
MAKTLGGMNKYKRRKKEEKKREREKERETRNNKMAIK